jgi:tRNA dimethylallyltransferase
MAKIAAIVGPTASGKTGLAVALKAQLGLPVHAVVCDALQVYAGLDAATAKPDDAERAALPHALLDAVPATEPMNAGRYVALADEAIDGVRAAGRWPLLVGGTGLYLRALVDGIAPIPPVPRTLRAALEARWDAEGAAALYAELQRVDPAYAATTPATNRQRVLRALEVFEHTGRAFSAWHEAHRAAPPRHDACVVVLEPPVAHQHAQIEARARRMVAPLLAEVAALCAAGLPRDAPGLQGLGYREALALVIDGTWARQPDAAIAALTPQLIAAHRRYARRQRTWFRRVDARLRLARPVPAGDPAVVEAVGEVLSAHLRA